MTRISHSVFSDSVRHSDCELGAHGEVLPPLSLFFSLSYTNASLFYTKFLLPFYWCTLSFSGGDKLTKCWRCKWLPGRCNKSSDVAGLFEQRVKFGPCQPSCESSPIQKVWGSYVPWLKFAIHVILILKSKSSSLNKTLLYYTEGRRVTKDPDLGHLALRSSPAMVQWALKVRWVFLIPPVGLSNQ